MNEFKKEIEDRHAELVKYTKKYPQPVADANDTNPQHLLEYGIKVGEKDALEWVLSVWPVEKKKPWKKSNG